MHDRHKKCDHVFYWNGQQLNYICGKCFKQLEKSDLITKEEEPNASTTGASYK